MSDCQKLKDYLVENGVAALRSKSSFTAHLADCSDCQNVLDAYALLPELLDALPERAASESLLVQTSEMIDTENSDNATSSPWSRHSAGVLGTAMVMLAVLALSPRLLDELENADRAQLSSIQIERAPQEPLPFGFDQNGERQTAQSNSQLVVDGRFTLETEPDPEPKKSANDSEAATNSFFDGSVLGGEYRSSDQSEADKSLDSRNRRIVANKPAPVLENETPAFALTPEVLERPAAPPDESSIRLLTGRSDTDDFEVLNEELRKLGAGGTASGGPAPPAVASQERLTRPSLRLGGMVGEGGVVNEDYSSEVAQAKQSHSGHRSLGDSADRTNQDANDDLRDFGMFDPDLISRDLAAQTKENSQKGSVSAGLTSNAGFEKRLDEFGRKQKGDDPLGDKLERQVEIQKIIASAGKTSLTDSGGSGFLNHYQRTTSLAYKDPDGYWANHYVPGDPQIRLLGARLARWDRSSLGEAWRLEREVTPIDQPFDAPADNALALSVMSDANAVDGPTRMRIQVGLRGIEHLRGQRPAMNLAVVLDLPDDADDSVRIEGRALLEALLSSKRSGDRFSLVLNDGSEDSTILADDFRYGSLQLAMQNMLNPATARPDSDLARAILQAAQLVKSGDDPSRPLGSSAILLITAGSLSEVDALTTIAHHQAKNGITLSVFPLGDKPQSESVEEMVLAGLGNRRYLESAEGARALVEEELHSASRAVARAARLSIRLAPGVHLVDVIGSRRLDVDDSQKVKEIETTMDQRLRNNLGIDADRGDDEDGIQIIIPSVFADDSLTVLIDVVVDQAGPVADVSLRYKDLVFKKNGILRSRFVLPEGDLVRGPSELSVLKNLLAYHFGQAARLAADAVSKQDFDLAILELARSRSIVSHLRTFIAEWENDPELLRDERILNSYINVLSSPDRHANEPLLTDSLQYAAWAKVHRPLSNSRN